MKAAIYARKSTDDNDRNPENKSVTRQVERARTYAEAKGWTVNEEHIFVDDGISGAEFKRRPGLLRMLNHLKEFDCIVMSELSRLGREQTQTGGILAGIYAKGRCIIHFYLTDEELKFKTAVDKFMVSAHAFGAEIEREKASQRSRDALERKAAKGYNAGGACYGYDNLPIYATGANGEQTRSHVEYRINEEQAETIHGIFRAYADGHSHTTIAKALNLNGDQEALRKKYFGSHTPASPRRGKRGTGSWAPSAIREILYRQRYAGIVPFGETLTERPELRIIDEPLWRRCAQRLKEVAATYIRDGGQWWGRPSAEKYLLTGMGRCSCCGKSISVLYGSSGSGTARQAKHWYGCPYSRSRGVAVCSNDNRARMAWLDAAVIDAIRKQVLTPVAIAETIEKAAELVERTLRQQPNKPRELQAEARKLHAELERFLSLIAEGKAPDTVLAEIKRREQRLAGLQREQEALAQAPAVLTPAKIREMCGSRIKRFEELLLGDVPVARQALRKLLPEPLRISPAIVDGRRTLRFEGMTTLGPLFGPAQSTVRKAWRPHGDSNPGYRRERAMS